MLVFPFLFKENNVVRHVDLTDPVLHEPKGIGTAAANEVYVADGAGSGDWIDRAPIFPTTPYIETTILDIAGIPIAVPGAGDTDLRDDAGYVQFIQHYTADASLTSGFTVDTVTGELLIPQDGIYSVSFWLAFSEDFGNQTMAITGSKNGVFGAGLKPIFQDKTRDANNISNIGGGSIFASVAGDKIGIGVAATTAGTVTITDSVAALFMIQAT